MGKIAKQHGYKWQSTGGWERESELRKEKPRDHWHSQTCKTYNKVANVWRSGFGHDGFTLTIYTSSREVTVKQFKFKIDDAYKRAQAFAEWLLPEILAANERERVLCVQEKKAQEEAHAIVRRDHEERDAAMPRARELLARLGLKVLTESGSYVELDPRAVVKALEPKTPEDPFVCSACGSDDIEVTCWQNVNTEEMTDPTESDEVFCNACEERGDDPHVNRLMLRSEWLKEQREELEDEGVGSAQVVATDEVP